MSQGLLRQRKGIVGSSLTAASKRPIGRLRSMSRRARKCVVVDASSTTWSSCAMRASSSCGLTAHRERRRSDEKPRARTGQQQEGWWPSSSSLPRSEPTPTQTKQLHWQKMKEADIPSLAFGSAKQGNQCQEGKNASREDEIESCYEPLRVRLIHEPRQEDGHRVPLHCSACFPARLAWSQKKTRWLRLEAADSDRPRHLPRATSWQLRMTRAAALSRTHRHRVAPGVCRAGISLGP